MRNREQLESNAASVMNFVNGADTHLAKFRVLWPAVQLTLETVKIFTGKETDKKINAFEEAADNLCHTAGDLLINNYCKYWNSAGIGKLLEMAKVFTGPKTDAVINMFVTVSENICAP